jgi:hypothetical protein
VIEQAVPKGAVFFCGPRENLFGDLKFSLRAKVSQMGFSAHFSPESRSMFHPNMHERV